VSSEHDGRQAGRMSPRDYRKNDDDDDGGDERVCEIICCLC